MEAAAEADVAIVVVGDRAGLFGRGTVGEGNDVESLELPGVQRELVEAVVATGTPVVMVLLTGRPYAVGWALDAETAPRAVLQAFFPGEEGGSAIASILSGAYRPERAPAGLAAPLGRSAAVLLPAPDPGRPERDHEREQRPRPPVRVRPDLHVLRAQRPQRRPSHAPTEAPSRRRCACATRERVPAPMSCSSTRATCTPRVTRPVAQLLGYAAGRLEAGQEAIVEFDVPTARLAFTGRER